MLSNAYLLANFRFDTAENEQNFAEILSKTDNYRPLPGRDCDLTVKLLKYRIGSIGPRLDFTLGTDLASSAVARLLLKYRIAALQDGCVPPVLGAWVTLGIRGYGSQNWENN